MPEKDLIPSWLTSWIAWRNLYTDPGKEPFNKLKAEMGLDRMPYEAEWLALYHGQCPLCMDNAVVNNTKLGLVYCLCKVLGKVQELEMAHDEVRTRIEDGSLDDIVYPREMTGEYSRGMKPLVESARQFIKTPDYWMVIQGTNGIGKTHVLRAINTAMRPMALYISAGEFEKLTHRFRKQDRLDEFYDTVASAPILLIDDVGIDYGGPLVKSFLEMIVDYRYMRWPDLPLILATNLVGYELLDKAPRANDRLLDLARTKVFPLVSHISYRSIHPEMRP